MFSTEYLGHVLTYDGDKWRTTLYGRPLSFFCLETAKRLINKAVDLTPNM